MDSEYTEEDANGFSEGAGPLPWADAEFWGRKKIWLDKW